MSKTGHRILVDLGPATEGFAGIAQEARLLLHAFWKTPSLAPTALLYDDGFSVLTHRFGAEDDLPGKMENHALYLFKLASRGAKQPFRWLRAPDLLKRYFRMACGLFAQMQTVDNRLHGESIWRIFLTQSLGASGLELARECPMALANLSRTLLKIRAWLKLPTMSLNTTGFDFLLMHEPAPIRVPASTCKLIRYHDLIPGLRPEMVGSSQQIKAHLRGIQRSRLDSVFVCNSEPTRRDLLHSYPDLEERSVTIPDLLGEDLYADRLPNMVSRICDSRAAPLSDGTFPAPAPAPFPPFLLMVSTIEPRKNHLALIRAFEKLTAEQPTDLALIFVGSLGSRSEEIFQAMKPLVRQRRLYFLSKVPPQELRVLYSQAEAVVFPSFYEGFGYSPLEAMQCGTPAIASDIPTHRWVYGDAALYCDPFDDDDLRRALQRLVFTERESLRPKLIERGHERVKLYHADTIGKQWRILCDEIQRQGGGRNVANLKLANLALQEPERVLLKAA